ncbi:MAG TPA: helicase-associated domain-containing protein [Microbacterium sp.]|uniref:helicase-associated domain-containing protein n=1 Tax=Microbacterium sp. TaxID=51671 RepID=UPI002C502383|nr:helicase-associated domain-containing protein [Microbacterium sp.]HWI30271.1 helicase-associated domain-containing protein [Microbacterium sp.]
MPAMTTDARTLATRLAARDDHDLARLFDERKVADGSPWRDFFDAAEALLDAASIAHALADLPRPLAAELVRAVQGATPVRGEAAAPLEALALIDESGRPYAAVATALAGAEIAESPSSSPAPASPEHAARAAERAFTTIGALAETLIACLHTPLGRIGTGLVGAVDRRRLVDQGVVADPAEVDGLIALAETAGLLRPSARAWMATAAGAAWLREPTAARWASIARGLRAALPAGLRTAEGGWLDPAQWPAAYPLDPAWPARAAALLDQARLAGLVADDGGEPPWAAPLRRGEDADASSLQALLPSEVERVYLQNDLTAIAPGPLAPSLDVRLRTMAVRESHAQASTYRFTADSIASALTEGETAETLREFLAQLSLTGVPQPLEYLIERTGTRYGLVRVGVDPASGRTEITSADGGVTEMLAVDQALRPLGLSREGDGLRSRVARDAVYWALADARYPVIAVDETGRPETLHRFRLAPAEAGTDGRPERYATLVATLRAGQGADADTAWLGRELDAAVRTRSIVAVVVALPDGSSREFLLEATGLGGGRLRGRDKGADVERTLPVSSIVSVRTVA